MRIESSNIQMSSTRVYSSSHRIDESLRAWDGDRRPDFEAVGGDTVDLSERARTAARQPISASGGPSALSSEALSPEDQAELLLLEKLFEQVTGRKIKFQILRFEEPGPSPPAREAAEKLQRIAGEAQAARNGTARAGWGVEYDRVERFEEAERTTFSTTGVVKTADGREIGIDLNLTMSREFKAAGETHLRFGDAVRKDPLVINFGGTAAQLTTDKFSFDLDLDGDPDQISFVEEGAGFLAIDRNGDGAVNDGSELFGPATGNGFSELAAYDTDHNQWIDEGDAVFNRLRIWTKDSDGTDRLLALGKAGVGAIYLGHAATPFSLNDDSNRSLGVVQSTGIWLGENGRTGTVQHLDLVV
ncbi:MAG TPA: hypothetical protein VJ302_13370 [Blastocatellia bacterium]|nr:hypothetical protein [Blastocatellia bacterium]